MGSLVLSCEPNGALLKLLLPSLFLLPGSFGGKEIYR